MTKTGRIAKLFSRRSRTGSALITEFGAALALLALCLVPVILLSTQLLITLVLGQAIAAKAANVASTSSAYDIALNESSALVKQSSTTGFGQLARLKPVSGFHGSGVDLSIQIEDKKTRQSLTTDPNTPLRIRPDCTKYEYSCCLVLHLETQPLLPNATLAQAGLSCLARPQIYNFTAIEKVEQPSGLCVRALSPQGAQR